MKILLLSFSLLLLLTPTLSANWAVLVAGSNGFWNYRHQSDICHAYHVLLAKGFAASNIIVFSYDDAANDSENPYPGKLFNKPTYANPGVDVYSGCKIDYKGADVSPANFLSVLKGDSAAVKGKGTGRVLGSTSTDRVFLNFADHGAPGLIAFPSEYLYSNDLLTTFDYMWEHKMYSELVFYLEACESGSMFKSLPKNTKIFALSAANPDESSWAAYCSPDDQVGGKSIGSCLGDLFSVNWMEDSDGGNVCSENLQSQFETVKKKTTQSQVMEWGDLSFSTESVGDFIGSCANKTKNLRNVQVDVPKTRVIDSRDVKLVYLKNKYEKNPTLENKIALQIETSLRNHFDSKFYEVAAKHGFQYVYENNGESSVHVPEINAVCIKNSLEAFEKHCGKLNDYALKHVRTLAVMCHYQTEEFNRNLERTFEEVCKLEIH